MLRKIIVCLLLVSMITSLSACSSKKEETRYQAQFLELFNTVTQIIGYAETKEDFSAFAELIYDELNEYHKLYDIYNTYDGINNLKTINDNAGISPVKVDQKIIDLLLFCKDAYNLTSGKVNVALGAVLEVWHQYRTEGIDFPEDAKLPPMNLLEEKINHTDINKLIINEEEQTVYLEDKDMSLDVGSIAKGYAVEMVCQTAIEKGYESGLVSVGGNVRSIGSRDGKSDPWNVGVQNPDLENEDNYLYILDLIDKSLVTSGVYQRYYTVDGKTYHHIIDSNTLMPSDYFTAVSIVCKHSGLADVLSTALFNMPYEDGLKLIESLDDTEALWVLKTGEIKFSSNFEDYIKK